MDTHRDVHVSVALSTLGVVMGTASIPATAVGYRELWEWVSRLGTVHRAGVEGSGSYGAALSRYLLARRVEVFEVNRLDRSVRRRRGKPDPVDAQEAARAVLGDRACFQESGTVRDRIIRATNSQTQLPAGALRATESIQKDVEESLAHSGSYYYERRASYYRNLGFPLDQVVSMARLTREFTAFVLLEPHTALRHSEALLLDDKHYRQIQVRPRPLPTLPRRTHRLRRFLPRYAEDRPLLGETVENWLYPLACLSAYTLIRLRQPTGRDLLNIDLDHLNDDLMDRMTRALDQNFKSALRNNKAGGVDRIARDADFTTKFRQSIISQSRFHIER
ncbi:AIPR family protein [Streptomyces nigrescens]|uniref:AIPR family protein n=1 Tax=Streptomyces nigrescens TaxID=1920 RepID=UPI00348216BE